MGNTIIQINPYDKRLNVKIEGTLLAGDDMEFYRQFSKEISPIQTSKYNIEVDCTDLYVNTSSQIMLLETIYLTIKSEDFNQILLILKYELQNNNPYFVHFTKKHT